VSCIAAGAVAVATLVLLLRAGWLPSFDTIKANHAVLAEAYGRRPALVAAAFVAGYVAWAALALPAAVLLTLLAGAVFGTWLGTLLVSVASTVGAAIAFLSTRTLLRDALRRRAGARLAAIDRGVARDGAAYLLMLRLVPLLPFFMCNPLMGLTPMRLRTFCWATLVGMLPGTLLYVNAGTQLARLESVDGILSPTVFASLAALGLLPLLARRFAAALASRSGRLRRSDAPG
jgi:uncharacterized membrane protein YdjX (TVP38/TMEM64 family)